MKRFFINIILLTGWLGCLLVIGVALTGIMLLLGDACKNAAYGEWYEYSPAGAKTDCDIYTDVLSRCKRAAEMKRNYPDKATICHEATHVVNGQITDMLHGASSAFYVGGGRVTVLDQPRGVTLRDVADRVTEYRNVHEFKIYLVDARHDWNSKPLYVLDEWTAYCNDVQCTNELRLQPDGGADRAKWFASWSDTLVATIKELNPNYPQLAELEEFVAYQKARVAEYTNQGK